MFGFFLPDPSRLRSISATCFLCCLTETAGLSQQPVEPTRRIGRSSPVKTQIIVSVEPKTSEIKGKVIYTLPDSLARRCEVFLSRWQDIYNPAYSPSQQWGRKQSLQPLRASMRRQESPILLTEDSADIKGPTRVWTLGFRSNLHPSRTQWSESEAWKLHAWYPELRCQGRSLRQDISLEWQSERNMQPYITAQKLAETPKRARYFTRNSLRLSGVVLPNGGAQRTDIVSGVELVSLISKPEDQRLYEYAITILRDYAALMPELMPPRILLTTSDTGDTIYLGSCLAVPSMGDREADMWSEAFSVQSGEQRAYWQLAEHLAKVIWQQSGVTWSKDLHEGLSIWLAHTHLKRIKGPAELLGRSRWFYDRSRWSYNQELRYHFARLRQRLTHREHDYAQAMRIALGLGYAEGVLPGLRLNERLMSARRQLQQKEANNLNSSGSPTSGRRPVGLFAFNQALAESVSLDNLDSQASKNVQRLRTYLLAWTEPDAFWQPELEEVSISGSGKRVIITMQQNGTLQLPVPIRIHWPKASAQPPTTTQTLFQSLIQPPAREKAWQPAEASKLRIEIDPDNIAPKMALDSHPNTKSLEEDAKDSSPANEMTAGGRTLFTSLSLGKRSGLGEEAGLHLQWARPDKGNLQATLGYIAEQQRITWQLKHRLPLAPRTSSEGLKLGWPGLFMLYDLKGSPDSRVSNRVGLSLGLGDGVLDPHGIDPSRLSFGLSLDLPAEAKVWQTPFWWELTSQELYVLKSYRLQLEHAGELGLTPLVPDSYFWKKSFELKQSFYPWRWAALDVDTFFADVSGFSSDLARGNLLDPQNPAEAGVRLDLANIEAQRARRIWRGRLQAHIFDLISAFTTAFPEGSAAKPYAKQAHLTLFHDQAVTYRSELTASSRLTASGLGLHLPFPNPWSSNSVDGDGALSIEAVLVRALDSEKLSGPAALFRLRGWRF